MTFIVARQFASGRIRVGGDLRVIDSNEIQQGYPFAALKVVILSDEILIGCAGNLALAMHTLRELPRTPSRPDQILHALTACSKSAGLGAGAVAFLVATRGGDGIWRVLSEGTTGPHDDAWIGDYRAFDYYQQAYQQMPVGPVLRVPGISPETPLPVSEAELEATLRMSNALHALEADAQIASVGEAIVTAFASADAGFRYDQRAFLAADHVQTVQSDEWVASDWGTVANGGFGYTLLVPTDSGIGVVGLHFPHAQLGLLYHPLSQDDPFVFKRVTHTDFRDRVWRDHGIAIDGPST